MIDEATLRPLIGIPFEKGGRGPDTYDCYGLAREMFRRDGIIVPDHASPEGNSEVIAVMMSGLSLWERCEAMPGTLVVFNLPLTMHCGYVLPNHRMIHCWKWSNGVCIEPLKTWERRIEGFYRYVRK